MSDVQHPDFCPVVIAPTHRNARTLAAVLDQLNTLNLPVIVVNDGSDDATAEILLVWAAANATVARSVLTHPENLGKAAALQTGFNQANLHHFTHAVTIDTDLQHDVADVPTLLNLSRANPAALIVGSRSTAMAEYPRPSRVGRWVSNLLVWIESGVRVSDSQCGLRVYPLEPLRHLHASAGRYGYETEIITRAGWAGLQILEAPIRCIYDVPQGRVSHFRPVLDSIRAVGTHIRLLMRTLTPWPIHKLRTSDTGHGTICERLFQWFDPTRLWRDIRNGQGDGRFPASVAAGMFMAFAPFYGFKTVICLAMSKLLRLQPLIVIAASSMATPPIGPLLAVLSIVTGCVLLHRPLPNWSQFDLHKHALWNALGSLATEWIVGSVVCGTLSAAIAYLAASFFVRVAARGNRITARYSTVASAASPATEQAAFQAHN